MRIYDPYRLQVGVDDNRSHELHTPALQIPGNFVRQFRADLACLTDRLPFRPMPEVSVKAPPLLLDGPEDPSVVHGGADLPLVPDNAGVLLQRLHLFFPVFTDRIQVKTVESHTKGLSFI